MRSFVPLSYILGLSLVSLGIAACASSTSPDGIVEEELDPMQVVCRNDINTGSRLPSKTCHTRQEWDEIAAANLEEKRKLERGTMDGSISDGSRH